MMLYFDIIMKERSYSVRVDVTRYLESLARVVIDSLDLPNSFGEHAAGVEVR